MKKQGILSFIWTEHKRNKLHEIKMDTWEIKEHLKLITEKESVLPSRVRMAITLEAKKQGISL